MHTTPLPTDSDSSGAGRPDPSGALELLDEDAGVRVIVLRGDHDLSSASAMRLALLGARRAELAVVVELSFASFIDSTILGVIVGALRDCREDGRGCAVVAASDEEESVPRLLEVTGMRAVFPVFEDRSSAVEHAAAGHSAGVAISGGHAT